MDILLVVDYIPRRRESSKTVEREQNLKREIKEVTIKDICLEN